MYSRIADLYAINKCDDPLKENTEYIHIHTHWYNKITKQSYYICFRYAIITILL